MIYTLANRPIELANMPIEGFPIVNFFPNSVWGGSKPKGIKEINMPRFLRWILKCYDIDNDGPICFETELIDSMDDYEDRCRLESVLLWTLQKDFPNRRIGVFDQSIGFGLGRFHPRGRKFLEAKRRFADIAYIGNAYFGPFYMNERKKAKATKNGLAWFEEVIAGRREVAESGLYQHHIMSINHTTIGTYKGNDELTVEMQRDFYVGDGLWRALCESAGGDVLVWTHYQQRTMLPEAEAIMREVQEATK